MGFFDRFKKKKELTPAMLRETMAKLKNGVKYATEIQDAAERENECKIILISVNETEALVNETLVKVENNIEDLMNRGGWWATQEAVNSDLRGLRRGRESLIAAQQELSKMKSQLGEHIYEKTEGQSEPGE